MPTRGTPHAHGVESASLIGDELAAVLSRHGAEAGHYSVLGPDPWSIIWNADRSGFVMFLEARHCVLSWRSPVARVDEHEALFSLLVEYARTANKQLFAVPVSGAISRCAIDLGLLSTWIGTECFIDLPTWSLAGGRRQKVRWARSHALKLGLSWREARPSTAPDDFTGLEHIEKRWKDERRERRTDSFLRNSFTELIALRRYFVCEGPQGIVASISCTPINATGWYLQDPVREPGAPRGALEGAMALALDTFRDEGYAVASNGPLPFWDPEHDGTTPHTFGPLGDRVLAYFDHRYRFQHINQFRSKFVPDSTTPVHLVRSHRVITPSVVRSLTRLLTKAPRTQRAP
ncbi:MAG TPA: phosphatidylglycerol lysyltransferase domain-containing protein [Acidimicrobiales bacterium]|nr:phosphatidylglycerol lysyltransferase domain-containing protein [Acidimicrobiales bacterium]